MLVEDSLRGEIGLRDLGTHRLKDLGRPEVLFQLVAEGLKSEFPPLRSLENPELSNNLPASLSPFVGRSAELAEVRAPRPGIEARHPHGRGRVGEDRLALQAAAELLDGTGEGVWFVELAPISHPDKVPTALISGLELRQEADRSPLDSLLHALRDQTVLVTSTTASMSSMRSPSLPS